jgi:hypothetical protein
VFSNTSALPPVIFQIHFKKDSFIARQTGNHLQKQHLLKRGSES